MIYKNLNIKMLNLAGLLFLFAITACTRSKHYQFSIADDVSGEQLAARVSVTDQFGQTIHIDGKHTDVEYLGKNWCYTDGLFSVTSDSKVLQALRFAAGPETLPVKISTREARPDKQVIKLHRWIRHAAKGVY